MGDLRMRTPALCPDAAIAAIMAASGTEKLVNKSAVRRALGIVESKALNALVSQRRRANSEELWELLVRFERCVTAANDTKGSKRSWSRDFLVFLLSVIFGLNVEKVCNLTLDEIKSRFESVGPTTDVLRERLAVSARELFSLFSANSSPSDYLSSRFGVPVKAHSVRSRVSALMADGFDPSLFRSTDSFTYTLHRSPEQMVVVE